MAGSKGTKGGLGKTARSSTIFDREAGNRPSGHTRGCFARRGATAAAIIANAIFRIISEIGMTGAIFVFDIAIIFRALIRVLDHQRDRRARCHLLAGFLVGENTRENFHFVRFAALRPSP